MGWKKFQIADFYFDFYEKREVPRIYGAIFYKDIQNPILEQTPSITNETDVQWLIKLFPSYFGFKEKTPQRLRLKKIFRVKGFAIDLSNLDSAENYLKIQFKPNFRTSLRRRLKGLETCFDIRYEMFYGHIAPKQYEFLMQNLHTMLFRRFDQRNDENMALKRWNDYLKGTIAMINEKKASLFVIYDNERPIQISLCYHHRAIMFLAIPSYDIDYAKFGLGNLAIKKILEWCIDNEYAMLDMGYGAFDYKVKWCNETYDLEHHLFYNRSSALSRLYVYYVSTKTRFINFLLSKNVNEVYHQIINFFLGKKKSQSHRYTILKDAFDREELSNFIEIDPISNESHTHLRKPFYDFAYGALESTSNIKVYKSRNKSIYCFVGSNQIQRILFNS